MKFLLRATLAALAVLASACALPLGTSSTKGTVNLSLGASATSSSSRMLSIANDVESMEYQVTDLTGGEAIRSGAIAAGTSVLTFSLTAGHTYEVAVMVWPKQTVPGVTAGVTTFGDSALVTPVAGSVQVVPLWVHPFDTLAFHNAVVDGAVSAWSPLDTSAKQMTISGSPSPDPSSSRFFYGPRGKLYWYGGSSTTLSVYEWTTITDTLDIETSLFTPSSLITADQYVVAADPVSANAFYVVGVVENAAAPTATLYHISVLTTSEGSTATQDAYWDISDSLYSGFNSTYKPSVTVTALAVNPITQAVYVSSWAYGSYANNSDDPRLRSTIHRFSVGSVEGAGQSVAADAEYGDTTWFDSTGAQSIFRDLTFRGGELLALGSPAINEGNATTYNVGTATVVRFSTALKELGRLGSPAAQTYTANTSAPVESTGGQLGYPLSFATGGHGATVFVNQSRASGSNNVEALTQVNLLTGEGDVVTDPVIVSSGETVAE